MGSAGYHCLLQFILYDSKQGSFIGVGPYTSAAIASIAFNQPCAAVDGNVVRVISRFKTLGGDPKKLVKDHQRLASDILDTTSPGDFNQVISMCHCIFVIHRKSVFRLIL